MWNACVGLMQPDTWVGGSTDSSLSTCAVMKTICRAEQSWRLFWDFQTLACLSSNFISLTITEATCKDLKMLLSNLKSQKIWPVDLVSEIKKNSHDLFDRHC